MVAKKGSRVGTAGEDAEEERPRVLLQAVLLADSFATLFRPITLERPKVPILVIIPDFLTVIFGCRGNPRLSGEYDTKLITGVQ